MKKSLIIAALFLGFSATGFSQTTEAKVVMGGVKTTMDLVVTDKVVIDTAWYVYNLKDVNTGLDYVSLPTGEQLAIGEHVPVSDGQYNSFKVNSTAEAVYSGGSWWGHCNGWAAVK